MPWSDLGTKTPVLNQWILYDNDSINARTFRFTFGNLGGQSGYPFFKTYALVRMLWYEPGIVNRTAIRRIYPREESIVMDFDPPEEILERAGGLIWVPEVRKQIYRRWIGRSNEPAWTLQIEDYIPVAGEAQQSINDAVRALNRVSRLFY